MMKYCDFLVVGAGSIGLATANELARQGRSVIMIEAKDGVCDCAMDSPALIGDPLCFPNAHVRALASASGERLKGSNLLRAKSVLYLLSAAEVDKLIDMEACCSLEGAAAEVLDRCELECEHPYLRCGSDCAAGLRVDAQEIDAAAYYRSCYASFIKCGGEACFRETLESACYGGGAWTVCTSKCQIRAKVIVNCAGAMADEVARRCEARRVGLLTSQRTCLTLSYECDQPGCDSAPAICWKDDALDLCCDFRSRSRVFISCLDDTRSCPPDDRRIGTAILCVEECTALCLDARSGQAKICTQGYASDGRPIIGWPRETPAFFWCAGLGDFGVACAPAVSALACDMLLNRSDFTEVLDRCRVSKDCLCPDRLGFAGVVA